jgi:hypothetical protein
MMSVGEMTDLVHVGNDLRRGINGSVRLDPCSSHDTRFKISYQIDEDEIPHELVIDRLLLTPRQNLFGRKFRKKATLDLILMTNRKFKDFQDKAAVLSRPYTLE